MRPHNGGVVSDTIAHEAGTHMEWAVPRATPLLNPDASLGAVVLKDGRVIIVHPYGRSGLNKLAISISYDGGENYDSALLIESKETRFLRADAVECDDPELPGETDRAEFGSPSIIQSPSDGRIHIVYTYSYAGSGGRCVGRENLKHVVIDPCKIGDPSSYPRDCSLKLVDSAEDSAAIINVHDEDVHTDPVGK